MDISSLTAVQLSERIRKREIACREAVEAVLNRIAQKEEQYHCYISLDGEAALESADEVQKKIDAGLLSGPLAGVPVAVKDNICVAGRETTCASRILSGCAI